MFGNLSCKCQRARFSCPVPSMKRSVNLRRGRLDQVLVFHPHSLKTGVLCQCVDIAEFYSPPIEVPLKLRHERRRVLGQDGRRNRWCKVRFEATAGKSPWVDDAKLARESTELWSGHLETAFHPDFCVSVLPQRCDSQVETNGGAILNLPFPMCSTSSQFLFWWMADGNKKWVAKKK